LVSAEQGWPGDVVVLDNLKQPAVRVAIEQAEAHLRSLPQ